MCKNKIHFLVVTYPHVHTEINMTKLKWKYQRPFWLFWLRVQYRCKYWVNKILNICFGLCLCGAPVNRTRRGRYICIRCGRRG